MKALVSLSNYNHHFSTCLYGKYERLWVSVRLLEYFCEKKLPSDYPCKSHDHDHQWAVLDYSKTNENVIITLLDMCLFTFYSVHTNESTSHWL